MSKLSLRISDDDALCFLNKEAWTEKQSAVRSLRKQGRNDATVWIEVIGFYHHLPKLHGARRGDGGHITFMEGPGATPGKRKLSETEVDPSYA